MEKSIWLTKQRVIFILIVLGVILSLYKSDWFGWSGFGESRDKNILTVEEKSTDYSKLGRKTTIKTTTTTEKLEPSKTLWDWMNLILAPATLAGLGFAFQYSLDKDKENKAKADKEANEARENADKAANEARENADKAAVTEQQHETALQDYLNGLSVLLVDKKLKQLLPTTSDPQQEKSGNDITSNTLDRTAITSELSISKAEPAIDADAALDVVKARTLSLMRMFDNDIPRKSSILSFLGDADLLTELKLDLSGYNFQKADLRRANLVSVELSSADLSKAKLNYADLSFANLSYGELTSTQFCNANLQKTKLSRANFSFADLSSANLSDADLSFASLGRSNLKSADLSSANLISADLGGSNLKGADLTDADLTDADLTDADLTDATLGGANLTEAKLGGAKLRGVDLSGAKLRGAKLRGVDLSDAKLGSADLSRADLSDANLKGAKLGDADLSRADLSDADLKGAKLGGANLSRAKFGGANFSFADLSYAYLSSADFIDGDPSPLVLGWDSIPSNADIRPPILGWEAIRSDADPISSIPDETNLNLKESNFNGANLNGAILLAVDLSNITGLEENQLTASDPPLLCATKLPADFEYLSDRDCDQLPEVLLKKYSNHFKNLEEARQFVDRLR